MLLIPTKQLVCNLVTESVLPVQPLVDGLSRSLGLSQTSGLLADPRLLLQMLLWLVAQILLLSCQYLRMVETIRLVLLKTSLTRLVATDVGIRQV